MNLPGDSTILQDLKSKSVVFNGQSLSKPYFQSCDVLGETDITKTITDPGTLNEFIDSNMVNKNDIPAIRNFTKKPTKKTSRTKNKENYKNKLPSMKQTKIPFKDLDGPNLNINIKKLHKVNKKIKEKREMVHQFERINKVNEKKANLNKLEMELADLRKTNNCVMNKKLNEYNKDESIKERKLAELDEKLKQTKESIRKMKKSNKDMEDIIIKQNETMQHIKKKIDKKDNLQRRKKVRENIKTTSHLVDKLNKEYEELVKKKKTVFEMKKEKEQQHKKMMEGMVDYLDGLEQKFINCLIGNK